MMSNKDNRYPSRQIAQRVAPWMYGIAVGALLAPQAHAQNAIPAEQGSASVASEGQQAADLAIGDIIVTAQKRSESVQRTPIAITAIGGENLRSAGISSVAALTQSVPGLQLGKFFGVPGVTLRGITLNALNFGVENPIAFHTDGIYYGRPATALSGFYDIERVEVLRGAQGTLYGRNATGGSINIITADPTAHLSGYAQLNYGNYDHLAVEGAVGGPLSEKVQVRIAGRWDYHDGYGVNEATGRKIDDNRERAIRGKVKILPTEDLTILLAADYYRSKTHPGIHFQGTISGGPLWGAVPPAFLAGFVPGAAPTKLRNISQEYDPTSDSTFWGLSSTINLDLGSISLRSITGYRSSKSASLGDVDLTSASLISPSKVADDATQFSQELQIIGEGDSAHWIVGGYYFHEKDDGSLTSGFSNVFLPLFGAPTPATIYNTQGLYTGSQIKTDAYAIFGQYTRKFTDQLSVTLGGRYSIETKSTINQNVVDLFSPFDLSSMGTLPATLAIQCGAGLPTIGYAGSGVPCDPKHTWKAFTPKVGIDFQITPQTLFYASYTKGFKSGTYNFGVVQDAVKPEKLDDFEVGIKSTLLDGRLRANLAGFYYNYKDVQVYNTRPTQTVLENAAAAKIYGLEAEVIAKPTQALQFDLNGSWLHTEYSKYVAFDQLRPGGDGVTTDADGQPAFNLKGNSLPQAPRLSGRLGAAYTLSSGMGDFTLRGEAVYTSKLYITQYNTDPVGAVKARTRFNLSLNFDAGDGHLYASLNAKNLGNKVKVINGYAGSPLAGGAISGYLEAPRTVDFTIGYKF
ncbi:TonB-dependent receptor [Sphingobium sp. TB-6]|uniref:TonB-dependent receptor n=1 Tax=Sphingobium sp. TB-6 TaxID=2728850 RepID=UPI00146D4AE1|nr:TonB-dependent receptor [Sphingobium sp. TB-6]NML87575.1 TonB-dependent receptor [Sphingobium sp. TB-6]